ncbi:MAG: hypothetical protein F6K19_16525 [Cyanothece sp. SIO1E1]|nr:hypothetical protein [Cyanothece sp. SIO1E1]
MNAINFVKELRHFILGQDQYKKQLDELDMSKVKDEFWLSALRFYRNLDSESQEIFISIIRQIKADTTSLILGILDGTMILENQEEDFYLGIKGKKDPINGELQQIFLGFEEDNEWDSYV